MRDVIISGIGMTAFGKFMDRNLKSLSEEAVSLALADAGIAPAQVDQVIFGNAAAGVVTGQEMIRAQSSLRNTGLDGVPMFNVENACASSSSAFHLGWLMIASGQAECVLVMGSEKLTHEDKAVSFGAFSRAVDLEEPLPEGYQAGSGSLFMDLYAVKARKWLEKTGGAPEDFGRVVVKSRHAGSLNPVAQFRKETTLDEVMASRMISDPLTLFMCSSIGDGAAAIVLTSPEFAKKLDTPDIRVRASAVVSAKAHGERDLVAVIASRKAYEMSGIGPEDLDVIELHDASAPAELIHYENLGLCAPGGAIEMIRNGDTAIGGRVPVNPSGGLLSRGHPIGATGAGQIIELVQHLRGTAGARQRDGAKVALAENNGGQLAGDSAVAVVTILSL
ncbi:thiolase family protein [Rhodovulum sulfidophilum]|uniref:propanoyl-CoA C-acyltransferase n=1 Tax=Rhodovulum sulfidophilum TaxID=35806 RepID=A0ABS1RTZ6_RHOSU|nr:thiolase family protein [Rhodovulum sulfidophilum]MBL3609373.1 thiolase family protein [Rhodovulum sulfidophilum]MCE8455547.1 thiolase family protein [Rhodovulum sulfidophilum]